MTKNIKQFSRDIAQDNLLVMTLMLLICAAWLTGCESYEDDYSPRKADKPFLKSTASTVDLNQKRESNIALSLNWTAGNNGGTNSAITYTLEVAKAGDNFSNVYTLDAGKGGYASSFTVADLNTLLRNQFAVDAGSEAQLEFRVISQALDASVQGDTSNVVLATAVPYEPMPVPANLYLVGDATPNGWDNNNPTPMTKSGNEVGVFSWQGQLKAGEFKLLTTVGQWLPSYQKGADETSLVIRTDFGQPDEKFTIATGGLFKVTVDVIELTIEIEALAASPYNELWIVGSATPKGWDIGNADAMRQDPTDPFIFTFNEVLAAGEFKIATAKDWGALFYRPTSADQPITETSVQLSAGDPDYKWNITEPGAYKITLDLRENTIDIKPYTPYANLWMVGDATPAGWNIGAPEPMVRESDYIFTWTGQLNAGEFKFPIATGDWGTGYFMPYHADESIAGTLITFRPNGNPDTKWRVQPGEAGIYKITLDQLHHTISIEKQ